MDHHNCWESQLHFSFIEVKQHPDLKKKKKKDVDSMRSEAICYRHRPRIAKEVCVLIDSSAAAKQLYVA